MAVLPNRCVLLRIIDSKSYNLRFKHCEGVRIILPSRTAPEMQADHGRSIGEIRNHRARIASQGRGIVFERPLLAAVIDSPDPGIDLARRQSLHTEFVAKEGAQDARKFGADGRVPCSVVKIGCRRKADDVKISPRCDRPALVRKHDRVGKRCTWGERFDRKQCNVESFRVEAEDGLSRQR